MTRFPLLIPCLLLLCLSLIACSKSARTDSAGQSAPPCPGCNVVLVSMDTVRADHLGAYGYPRNTSPNLDRLARRSIVFEHAISQTAWTLPGHGSMMTGLYPSRLGVQRYPAIRKLPDVTLLAEVFKQNGYATGGFTGGGFVSAHFGFARGFDVYSSKGRRFEHNLQDAIQWLKNHRKKRFFLFLHGYDAHRPYYSDPADRRAVGLPKTSRRDLRGFCSRSVRKRPEDLATIVRYYDAAIHHGDAALGRLLTALRKLGIDRKTVVLITSDHGEEFFEHGHCDHVRFLYQEVIHVPYVLHIPGLRPQGTKVKDVVPASISVARTLLDSVGIAAPIPGVSLLRAARTGHATLGAVFSETSSPVGSLGSRGTTIAMTTIADKLIEYTDEGSSEGYDLLADPGETHILPENHPVYRKRHALRSWHESLRPLPRSGTPSGRLPRRGRPGRTPPPKKTPKEAIPKDLRDTLRSLGYLE